MLHSIKDIIDRLYRLSTKIRNPSTRLTSSKAHRFRQVDDEHGVDLLQTFEHLDLDFTISAFVRYRSLATGDLRIASNKEACADSSDRDWHVADLCIPCQARKSNPPIAEEISRVEIDCFLTRRTARANVARRQQFAYWKYHSEKIAALTEKQSADENLPVIAGPMIPSPRNDVLPRTSVRIMQPIAASVTTATQLPAQLRVTDGMTEASVSEYSPSLYEPTKEGLNFPPPPKAVRGQDFFRCPYCFTLCPKAYLAVKSWR